MIPCGHLYGANLGIVLLGIVLLAFVYAKPSTKQP